MWSYHMLLLSPSLAQKFLKIKFIHKISHQITRCQILNLFHPNISMHILHTVLYTFHKMLTRRICSKTFILTMANFSLSICSYYLKGLCKRQPFCFLFFTSLSLNWQKKESTFVWKPSCSNEHCLSRSGNNAWKNSGIGFEPITYVIPV